MSPDGSSDSIRKRAAATPRHCTAAGKRADAHRRRQDLPLRPGIPAAMADQPWGPCRAISRFSSSSSSGTQAPFLDSSSHRDDMLPPPCGSNKVLGFH